MIFYKGKQRGVRVDNRHTQLYIQIVAPYTLCKLWIQKKIDQAIIVFCLIKICNKIANLEFEHCMQNQHKNEENTIGIFTRKRIRKQRRMNKIQQLLYIQFVLTRQQRLDISADFFCFLRRVLLIMIILFPHKYSVNLCYKARVEIYLEPLRH